MSSRITHPPKPSSVRVLGKSMYVFAGGWATSIGWLWIAEVQQHALRIGGAPPYYGASTLLSGVFPAAAVALVGLAVGRWTGRAPEPRLERREWWHAFWWSLVPNLLLLVTVWVMIQEAR